MKTAIVGLVLASALGGCALNSSATKPEIVGATAPGNKASSSQKETHGYTSAMVAEDRYEIKYSGPWKGSRDVLEGELLYRAALLAREHGSAWFRFLHTEEEASPGSHPSRPSASFGVAYGHWQPHWTYLTSDGWQPWHPEWGDRFWAERPTSNDVKQVELHAMVELRPGAIAAGAQTDFEVSSVLRDLNPRRPAKGR